MDLSNTIEGNLELTIKINQLPKAKAVKDGWQTFTINCEGVIIEVTVRPKVWLKLTQSAAQWPQWVALYHWQSRETCRYSDCA